LNETRQLITSLIDVDGRRDDELRHIASGDGALAVLSDENFVGVPQSLLKTGLLYPDIENRMAPFLVNFSDVNVFFCVRNYATFWPSLYCEIIRHQAFLSWTEFLSHFEILQISWKSVVSSLVKKFGEHRLTLWDYADFRHSEPAFFEQLLGSRLELKKAGPHVRESPSDKAIKTLTFLTTILSDQEIRRLVWPISKALPRDANHGPFRPFTEQMEARLSAKFLQDIFDIRATHPSINWL
jgi:hypothetical protein